MQRIGRMGLVGTDHLHRAGLVKIKTPLRDVKMVGAPVSIVAGSVIVVKTPEHRIKIGDLAGCALVGIGRPGRRTEPHVPVDILVGRGFRGDVLNLLFRSVPLAEEAMRMRGTAKIRGEVGDIRIVLGGRVAVVAVNILDVADETVADDHAGGAEFAPGTLHGAGLENALEFFLGLNEKKRLLDGIGQRFFAIDIFSGLHRGAGDVGMPMIRRRNADRVNSLVTDDIAEISDGHASGKAGFLIFPVIVIDIFHARFPAHPVAVANGLDDNILLLDEIRHQHGARLNSIADEGQIDHLLRRRFRRCFRRTLSDFFRHDATLSCL